MDDFFENNVCSICKHKSENCKGCMILETHNQEDGVFCYKCLNYQKDPSKINKGEYAVEEFFLERIMGGKEFGKVKIYYEGKAIYEEKLSKDYYCT